MYVFARSRQADPARVPDVMRHAVELAEAVRAIAGFEVVPWVPFASPEVGRITWAAFIETMAALGEASDRLAADQAYRELLDEGSSLYVGSAQDSLVQLVHGRPSGGDPSCAVVVTAELANGHLVDGLAKGVEIAEKATHVSGLDTMFGVGVTGAYAGVAWFTAAPDLGALEAAQAKLVAEPSWLTLVDGAGGDFNPGVRQVIYRRLRGRS